ncbi:bifunctional phosphopantothenoylcysteine decarboxylase/phosphopantothenate--cysteine ligase CoaBC [uncultured Kocuria sp.]|uniref:bifunctional phosphopantothenoylcysteine decarboxylase/phosphopantothenate--cysteine ligase CoaBC n=1 Tax=uncultured Kocuria sp. TaxID=259305 RepID=UPI002597435A|nr:bifunctional phosphopantothenoylcysteine decarboxylase/phosphopantothenate--cysteine ligase CoaBC [uncultured Kocuria sp.]MCT1366771.1 bifunctional phosphopantothenoylcysteine decarboxylase/phosphopantothenate--cysteine ligase CoaBC [Rothia sp. p3-SID1597]
MRIILGIGGGIAAYKAAMLLRLFSEQGHDVVAMPTLSSLNFVGAATWEALSGNPVRTSVFEDVDSVNHVRQAETAELIVVAPATADLMSKVVTGRADDLLTATILTATCPIVFAPAMHTQMWNNPATRRNVAQLLRDGFTVIEPAVGRLTGRDSGAGRLPEPAEIHRQALAVLASQGTENPDLTGRRIVVTAGGTREALDPVRYLGNRSSGRQGIAIAQAAADLGASVDLIVAHLEVEAPEPTERLRVQRVSSALELESSVHASVLGEDPADAVVMTAAVADFRPKSMATTKIKKDPDADDAPSIELVRNPDILKGLVESRRRGEHSAFLVGFAAETGSPEHSVAELGEAKFRSKGSDMLVVNEVGSELVFGRDETAATILVATNDGIASESVSGPKAVLARRLMTRVASHLNIGS